MIYNLLYLIEPIFDNSNLFIVVYHPFRIALKFMETKIDLDNFNEIVCKKRKNFRYGIVKEKIDIFDLVYMDKLGYIRKAVNETESKITRK